MLETESEEELSKAITTSTSELVDAITEQRPEFKIPLVDGYRSFQGSVLLLFSSMIKKYSFLHNIETEWWAYHPEVSAGRSSTELMFKDKEVDGPAQRDEVTASSGDSVTHPVENEVVLLK